ncbi:MAG: oxidoreductase [Myxococcota bacterium]|jgi:hypothetical protein|nr:oxidoreductase [Myxococcota bacterium]
MIAAWMVLFAVLDGAFAGFRGAAPCNARIRKRRYYARALSFGALAALVLCVALAALTLAFLAASSTPAADYQTLVAVGRRMLAVFSVYGLCVALALLSYLLGGPDLRVLSTVSILGPFTLIRPWMVLAALVYGLWGQTNATVITLTLASAAAVLLLGRGLCLVYERRLQRELEAPLTRPQPGNR